ncbi:hypothetical protein LCGC14_1821210, partial [marine sediment metagenome]
DSVFGRTGAVTAQQSDYDGFFLTPSEGNAAYSLLGHAHAAADITSGIFVVARIPNLNASKITAGILADARIPNLNASKITAGTLVVLRGGTGVTTKTGTGSVVLSASPTLTGTMLAALIRASTGYGRTAHHTGHLIGSYNNVAANSLKSNPIYTIGSAYQPTDAALSNMYGIGYSHGSATFLNSTDLGINPAASWGAYFAADGNARIFLDASIGTGYFKGVLYAQGKGVASWTTALTSARMTISTGAATGGANGDIHFRYTA